MLLGGVALVLVAVFFGVLYVRAQNGVLPYNRVIGLRTRAIMRSERVWTVVHRRFAWVFASQAIGFTFVGLLYIAAAMVPDLEPDAFVVACVAFVITLLVLIAGGVSADTYARRLNSRGEET